MAGCRTSWYGYPTNPLPHLCTHAWETYCDAHPSRCFFDRCGAGIGSGYVGPGAAAQRAINDGLSWLFAALDVISPALYLGVSNATLQNTTAYLSSTVEEALRLAPVTHGSRKRVLGVVWHHYDDYWRVPPPAPRELLGPTDLHTELLAPLAAGADGLLVWGHVDVGSNSSEGERALQAYADGPLASVMASLCSEYRCCQPSEAGCI